MTDYKLSIIVPAFNLENKINETFNSIKEQTIGFENIELIFVDDNSSDKTFEILAEYANDYDNVKVLKTDENSGFAGNPRNVGLENSTSDYILFLDGDDQLLVNSCEVLLNNITSNKADISIGAHINRYDNQIQEHNSPLYAGRNEVFESGNDVDLLTITPAISAKLFNVHFLKEKQIKFAEGIPGQDLVFLVEVLLNSKKINVLNNNYIYFRNINKDSISLNPNENYIYGLINAYSLLCDLFDKFDVDFDIQTSILQRHLGFFSMQILRSYNLKKIDENALKEIFNSQEYNNFIRWPVFENTNVFDEFFRCLSANNYKDARVTINNVNINPESNYSNLKKENDSLKIKQEKLYDEIEVIKDRNDSLNEKTANLAEEIRLIEDNLNALNEEKAKLTEQIKTTQNNLNTLKTEKNNLIKENKTITEDNERLSNKIKTLNESKNELNEKNTKLTEQIKTTQNNLNTLKTEKNNLISENKTLTQNNFSLKEQINKLDNKNETITRQNQNLVSSNSSLKEENKAFKNNNTKLEAENKKLNDENESVKTNNIMLKEQNDRLTEQNNGLNNEFVDLKNEFDNIKMNTEKILNSNKHLKEENTNLKDELNEIKSSRLWKLKNKF